MLQLGTNPENIKTSRPDKISKMVINMSKKGLRGRKRPEKEDLGRPGLRNRESNHQNKKTLIRNHGQPT